jgi:hypothetical protein
VFAASLVSGVAVTGTAMADDDTVRKGLEEVAQLFSQRSAARADVIEKGLAQLAQLEGTADDSDLNYDVLIWESKFLYWKGVHAESNDDKMKFHDEGKKKGDAATALNDNFTESYYYAGINLARWGEANGVVASLSHKGELIDLETKAINHLTREDQPGETIDGYGPDRVLGRVYFKLPSVFGGSHTESIKYLKRATTEAKNVALNVIYYAETLYSGDKAEKAEAKKVLDELLASDPKTVNPDRAPENIEEFEQAKKLRSEMK